MGECFGGEDEQGGGGGVVEQGVEEGERVAERFAGGGVGRHHDVAPIECGLNGLRLVAVRLGDTLGVPGGEDAVIERGPGGGGGGAGIQRPPRGDVADEARGVAELGEEGSEFFGHSLFWVCTFREALYMACIQEGGGNQDAEFTRWRWASRKLTGSIPSARQSGSC